MRLSDLSIKNPVMAWMIMFFLIIFGALSFSRLGISQYPDIDIPNISVSIALSGAPPEVIESTIIQPVEDALTTVEGVKSMSSNSRPGSGQIYLEFDVDRKIDSALQDIQTKMAQVVRRLPKDTEQPVISKMNPEDQPILFLALSSKDKSRREIMKYVKEHIKDEFTSLPGVGDLQLNGYIDPILKVQIDVKKIKLFNITVFDVIDAIQSEHNEIPAGQVETDTSILNIRIKGELKNPDDFKKIIIAKRAGQLNNDLSRKVRLEDVADVKYELADLKRTARFNSQPSVSFGIKKQRGTNAIEVSKAVKAKVKLLQKTLPESYKLEVGFDSTRFIEDSVRELNKHLLMAVLLTAFVCWVFLGSWSATLNVLLSIPTSIFGTFIVLYFLNYTLNIFTLLGLTLSIGIVVDDAIMVLENIFRNSLIYKNKFKSAIIGSREITFSAIAATAAVVAIFLPVAFLSGIIGKFFMQFGITISVAVLFSLLEALTITPMRSAYFYQSTERTSRFGKYFEQLFDSLNDKYLKVLKLVVANPRKTLLSAFTFTILSFFLIKFIKKEFVPQQNSGLTMISVQFEVGTPFQVTDNKIKEVELWLAKEKAIERYSVSIDNEPNRARIILGLAPKSKSGISQNDYHQVLRKQIEKMTKAKVNVFDFGSRGMGGGGGRGQPIEFAIKGPEWNTLINQTENLMKKMKESNLFIDIDSNLSSGLPELQIIPLREKASEMGVSVVQIGKVVNAMMSGFTATSLSEDSRRYDVVVSLARTEDQVIDLKNILIPNIRGNLILLSELVEFKNNVTQQQINREDRIRTVTVSAGLVKGGNNDQAWDQINQLVKKELPEGYYLENFGSSKEESETFSSLILALVLGLLVAYMILASQFNSFIDPVSVFVVLPFSISGVFLGLLLTGQTINMYSMIGILLLMGIVKKNSILLVDFANQETILNPSLTVVESMLRAGKHRLRPILMTSFATIAGAVPSALATGSGSELTKSMATSIIFGSFVATLFTLFVVPVVYIMLERFRKNRDLSHTVNQVFEEVGKQGLS